LQAQSGAGPWESGDAIEEFWGTGPNDVWAVGGHYQSAPPLAITSANPNDVWLALPYGFLHYDGVSWTNEQVNLLLSRVLGIRGAGVFFTSFMGHIYRGP
jgi:hypothetical protein